jgi:hypothetical protein
MICNRKMVAPSLTRTGDLTIMRQGESSKFTSKAEEK